MKGQELPIGMIIFAAQLILIFVMGMWMWNIGEAIMDYFSKVDARIIQEAVSGFYIAGEISNSSFSASMKIPPSPNIIEIGYENGYYVWVRSEEQKTVKVSGRDVEVKLSPTEKIPIPSFSNVKIEEGEKEFNEDKETILKINRTDNIISTVIE